MVWLALLPECHLSNTEWITVAHRLVICYFPLFLCQAKLTALLLYFHIYRQTWESNPSSYLLCSKTVRRQYSPAVRYLKREASPAYINASRLSRLCCQIMYRCLRHPLQDKVVPFPLIPSAPFLISILEYCVSCLFSSCSELRVTAFPGLPGAIKWVLQFKPSPVRDRKKERLKERKKKAGTKQYVKKIRVSISVGKCWSCYCFIVCIC